MSTLVNMYVYTHTHIYIYISTVIGLGSSIEDELVCLIKVEISRGQQLERKVQSVSG